MREKELKRQIGWLIRDKYAGKINNKLGEDIIRLKKGEPIDYIIGWKPFLNCRIDLSRHPFIPRPETEYWAEKAISEIKKRKKKVAVADIFSGSGCIGLAVLKNAKNTKVDFIEKNSKSIKQIEINLRRNWIPSKRYRVVCSDIFERTKHKYDFILANPPYVGRKDFVAEEVKKFEPRSAILAAEDGLAIIRRFLKDARPRLNPSGEIWLEFGYGQKKAIESLLEKNDYEKYEFLRDQYGRYRLLRLFFSHIDLPRGK
jgi:release factor glutamine methyltransferase